MAGAGIAVAVFARKCDVDDGNVRGELTTKKMLMDVGSTGKGASTKGGVSIEVRVGARSVCSSWAHLPADAGGRAPCYGTPARRLLRWR